jgi:hypothetical protein
MMVESSSTREKPGRDVVMLVVLVVAALLIIVGVGAYMLYLTPNPKDTI